MTTFVTKDGGLTIPADGRWHLVTAHDRATGELRRRFPVGEEGAVRLEYQLAWTPTEPEMVLVDDEVHGRLWVPSRPPDGLSVKWMRMPGRNVTAANDWAEVPGVSRMNVSPGAHFVDARPGFRAVVLAVQVIGPVPITLDVRVVKVTTEADR